MQGTRDQHLTPDDAAGGLQSSSIESTGGLDVFVHAAPASARCDEQEQFASMASRAGEVLAEYGLSPDNLVCGWIHFAKAPTWPWRSALADVWGTSNPQPLTGLVQPPASACFCTMRLHAIRSVRQSGVWHGTTTAPAAATVLRAGARHLRLMSITPSPDLIGVAPVTDQAHDMFVQADRGLATRGLSFQDVVRTWIYVRDIEHNYAALNQARNRYFAEARLQRLPASTCVEGTFVGSSAPVVMDLYAVGASEGVAIQAVQGATMGQATAYGSAFARAALLTEPGRKTLYVSGTASIDALGNVVAVGDIQGQLERMFENVRSLLEQSDCTWDDALHARVYLARTEDHGTFLRAAASCGISPRLPTTAVVAAICRPEWLCEIELCLARRQD